MTPIEQALSDLTDTVTGLTTVTQSVVAYLQGLAPILADNANSPAAIKAISANVKANADAIGAAVTASTTTPVGK